ncbi:hypothetical protein [Azospirillum largimobile]
MATRISVLPPPGAVQILPKTLSDTKLALDLASFSYFPIGY